MKFDERKVPEILRLVQKRFEGWRSVDNQAFVDDEITYKREAASKAQELLSESALSRLLDAGEYDAFIKRLEGVGQSTNLLFLSRPSSGDLSILYQPDLDKAAFCEAVFLLLHNSAPVEDRLGSYFTFVQQQELPQKWTFPTYFLFLLYPDSELFIKPMTVRWFVELMNGPRTYPWTPSAEAYAAMRELFVQLQTALASYGVNDMIDAQSVVWVAYQEAKIEEKRTLAEPFASMFADRAEAEWAFDLMADMVERLGYRDVDDPRFALTLAPGYLRLNFGNWLVLELPPGISGVALLDEKVPSSLNLTSGGFYSNSEKPAKVFYIPHELAKPFTEPLQAAYEESCHYMRERFKGWRGTPFRRAHLPNVFAALFDSDKREILLTDGMQEQFTPVERETHYWRITLPQNLELEGESGAERTSIWEMCLKHNIAAIDFDEDLSNPQVKDFASIEPGDRLVAFLREKEIGGIGEVTAAFDEQLLQKKPANQDYWGGKFWLRLGVEWTPAKLNVDQLPHTTANKFLQRTVQELTEEEFLAVQQLAAAAERYDETDFLAETYLHPEQLADLQAMMADKRQLIFYGPPGTGKTFVAKAMAKLLTSLAEPSAERVEIVQFHPAFGYEDFIEGIRPVSRQLEDGRYLVDYPPKAGIFRRFCDRAAKDLERPYVFIIDEINRGNIPRIFGELMLLLEYRDQEVRLPYSGEAFAIPKNVYLIGTMNTADRSIALVDFALRRRFHFFQFEADPMLYKRWLEDNRPTVAYLDQLFAELTADAIDDPAFQIGHSYFMDAAMTEEKLARIWQRSIEPYLVEYFMGQRQKAEPWHWHGERVRRIREGLSR